MDKLTTIPVYGIISSLPDACSIKYLSTITFIELMNRLNFTPSTAKSNWFYMGKGKALSESSRIGIDNQSP